MSDTAKAVPAITAEDIQKLIQKAQQQPGYADLEALMNLANEVVEVQIEQRAALYPATAVYSATGTHAA